MNKDNQIVIYRAKDGRTRLEVNLKRETVWLTQAQMATLFYAERSVITKHIRNIFQSKELAPKSNVQKMHIAGSDKPVAFYTLDMIIAVGYRVNSKRGTQFRIRATQVLRDHLLKGYTVNEKRLPLPLVPRRQPHSLPLRWHQTPGRQRPGCPHAPDRRKPTA